MTYSSLDMKRDGQNFLSFWTIFCTFTPLTTQKIKLLHKQKNRLEILSFYTCVPKMRIIWSMVPEILSEGQIFLSFWTIFCPFTRKSENQNFKKIKKTSEDIIILHMCNINDSHMIWSATERILGLFGPFFTLLPPP